MSSESGERASFQGLVERYRHLRGEHRRSGAEGTARRHLERDLAALESRIERRLALLVADEEERRQWRDHLHHGGPVPPPPPEPPPLVFHGVAADGIVEVHAHGPHEHRLSVDGAPRGPIPRVPDVLPPEGPLIAGMRCRETFTASPRLLAALREHVATGAGGEPPWEHAPGLLRDGLVDPDFGLTPRGRRALTGSRT